MGNYIQLQLLVNSVIKVTKMLKSKNILAVAIICLCLNNANTAFGKDVGVVLSKISGSNQAAVPQKKNAVANFDQGTNLYKQGDLKGAEAAFRKAIEQEPNFAQAYIALANTLNDQGKPQQAIAQYNKAISFDPKDSRAYLNLGLTLAKLNQLEAAIAQYKKALSLDPNYADVHYNLGNALYDQ